MKIGLIALGTRGDITPFLALAAGLRRSGNCVTISISTPYKSDYKAYENLYDIKIIESMSERAHLLFENLNSNDKDELAEFMVHLMQPVYHAAEKLCKENDIVIGLEGAYYLHSYAEKYCIPYITLSYQHYLTPSIKKPFAGYFDYQTTTEEAFQLSWDKLERDINEKYSNHVNEFRKRIGLEPIGNLFKQVTHSQELQLLSVSKVFCEQFDDWANHRYVCGFFELEDLIDVAGISEDLNDFIINGDYPVFFTLGSLGNRGGLARREQILIDVLKAAKTVNKRIIVQGAWKNMNINDFEIDDSVFMLDEVVDYKTILPFCSVFIHHGGAGTSHIALASGCPSIVIETGADTHLWAYELNRVGASPEKLYLDSFNYKDLVERLEIVLNSNTMRENARLNSEIMKHENGVQTAVNIICEKYAYLN